MIDPKCPIWLAGQGFCWTPSAAWGCSDAELCVKCKAKPRVGLRSVCVKCGGISTKAKTLCSACRFEAGRVVPFIPRKKLAS